MGEGENCSSGDDMIALLPYLSEGFCTSCTSLLETRLQNLSFIGRFKEISLSNSPNSENSSAKSCSAHSSNLCSNISNKNESPVCGSSKTLVDDSQSDVSLLGDESDEEIRSSQIGKKLDFTDIERVDGKQVNVPKGLELHTQVIDAAEQQNIVDNTNSSPASISNQQHSVDNLQAEVSLLVDESDDEIRMSQVGWKNDYTHIERVDGKQVNVIKGLELHTKVFNATEQNEIVDFVYSLQKKGQARKLKKRTYSEPSKWNRGKGRLMLQFGCCYNYAVDRKGNPPGIVRDEDVDPLPPMFQAMIKRLVRWHVITPTCVPNSCIVNILDEGDYIPPHIDHHDFVRPFCIVSFLTECNMLFGAHLKTVGDGKFSGPVSIPLPVGSALILRGNGADVAKHCVPGVPGKRISITFRKIDDSKLPYKFIEEPELQGLEPLRRTPSNAWSSPDQQARINTPKQDIFNSGQVMGTEPGDVIKEMNNNNSSISSLDEDNFPPLGSLARVNK